MYAGHFAIGVALHARFPRTPVWSVVLGIGLLDLLCGVFVATGIEKISPAPTEVLGLTLDFVDWGHSLLMSVVWALAFGALFLRRSRVDATVAAAAVLSHFVCDVLVHNGDLALWPGSSSHLGTYLWRDFPLGSWFFELAFTAAFVGWAILHSTRAGVPARAWRGTVVVLLVLQVSFLPAFSPLHFAARELSGNALAWAYGLLVVSGFLIPGLLLLRLLPGRRQ